VTLQVTGYKPGESFMHRLDGRVKFVFFVVFTVVAVSWNDPIYLTFLMVGIFIIGGLGRLTIGNMLDFIKPLVPWLVVVFVFNFFFFEWQYIPPWGLYYIGWLIPRIGNYGPYVHISLESVIYGLSSCMRFSIIVLCARILATFTSPTEIALSLNKMKMPPEFSIALGIVFGYIPVLIQQINAIFEAQKSRGWVVKGGRNPISKLRSYLPAILPIVFRSMTRAEFLGAAIASRGFGYDLEHRTYVSEPKMRSVDYVTLVLFITLLVGGVLIGIWVLGYASYKFTVDLVKRFILGI